MGAPFCEEGVFDFGENPIMRRVFKLFPVMLKNRLKAPPPEVYSLHRKLSGCFLMCYRLGAKVRARELFFDIYTKCCSVFRIFVEALADLLPQVPCIDHVHEQRAWSVFTVAELLVEHLLDCQQRIKTYEICYLERTHWIAETVLDCLVYIIACSYSLVKSEDCFIDIRSETPIHNEARDVPRYHHILFRLLHQPNALDKNTRKQTYSLVRSKVLSEVWIPGITSTTGILGTGFMK